MLRHRLLLTVATALALSVNLAEAAIINVTFNTGPAFEANNFMYLTPPWGSLSNPANTVGNNNFQDDDTLFAFDEFSGILPSAVTPDLGPLATIPAGTAVTTHFIFYDPRTINYDIQATIQFDKPILGVIRRTPSMDATDSIFALSGVNYPQVTLRCLETSDILNITGSDTIFIDWRTGRPGDHIRVITEFSPASQPPSPIIPEPSTIALYGIGGLGVCLFGGVLRRRTRRTE
jgi:hypothetical protein